MVAKGSSESLLRTLAVSAIVVRVSNMFEENPNEVTSMASFLPRALISQLSRQLFLLFSVLSFRAVKSLKDSFTLAKLLKVIVYINAIYKCYIFTIKSYNERKNFANVFEHGGFERNESKKLLKIDYLHEFYSFILPFRRINSYSGIYMKKKISYMREYNKKKSQKMLIKKKFTNSRFINLISGSEQNLSLFVAKKNIDSISKSKVIKCILFVHGGGWRIGHSGQMNSSLTDLLSSKEAYVVISVNHRLAPEVPVTEMQNDIATSIAWTKKYLSKVLSSEFNKTFPKEVKIVLNGQSAGGHLVVSAAMGAGKILLEGLSDRKVEGCINLYGVLDFIDDLGLKARVDKGQYKKYVRKYLLRRQIDVDLECELKTCPLVVLKNDPPKSIPPIFTAHGTLDMLVPIGMADNFHHDLEKYRKNTKSLVKDVLVRVKGGRHAFEVLASPVGSAFSDAQLLFVKDCFRKSSQ